MKIPKRKKRRVWLAFLLSLLYPGLGQIYCGRLLRGLGFVIGMSLLYFLVAIIISDFPASKLTLGIYLFFLLIYFGIASVDVVFVAIKTPSQYRLKEYNRWYIYILFIFLINGFDSDFSKRLTCRYVEPVKILSSSMFPEIAANDRLIVYKNPKYIIEPQVGDIIQFPHYAFSKTPILKRVVACGGDTVEKKNNQLFINDVPLHRTLVKTAIHQPLDLRENDENMVSYDGAIYLEYNRESTYPVFLIDDPNYIDNMPKRTIPAGCFFVPGDNRNLSIDSRRFGYVPESQIEGIARYLIWTSGDWSRWGLIDAKSNKCSINFVQEISENGVDSEEQSLFQDNG